MVLKNYSFIVTIVIFWCYRILLHSNMNSKVNRRTLKKVINGCKVSYKVFLAKKDIEKETTSIYNIRVQKLQHPRDSLII